MIANHVAEVNVMMRGTSARPWLAGVALLALSGLPSAAGADTIRISPARTAINTPAAGSIWDTDGNGVGDSGSYYMSVMRSEVFETRGFAKYDLLGVDLSRLRDAWFEATVDANVFNAPSREVAVSMYAGSEEFDLDDYAVATLAVGGFTLPAGVQSIFIRIPVTAPLRTLLEGGSSVIGFRFDAVGNMPSLIVGGHGGQFTSLVLDSGPVPEPASLLLVGTGLWLTGLAARRRSRKEGCPT